MHIGPTLSGNNLEQSAPLYDWCVALAAIICINGGQLTEGEDDEGDGHHVASVQ